MRVYFLVLLPVAVLASLFLLVDAEDENQTASSFRKVDFSVIKVGIYKACLNNADELALDSNATDFFKVRQSPELMSVSQVVKVNSEVKYILTLDSESLLVNSSFNCGIRFGVGNVRCCRRQGLQLEVSDWPDKDDCKMAIQVFENKKLIHNISCDNDWEFPLYFETRNKSDTLTIKTQYNGSSGTGKTRMFSNATTTTLVIKVIEPDRDYDHRFTGFVIWSTIFTFLAIILSCICRNYHILRLIRRNPNAAYGGSYNAGTGLGAGALMGGDLMSGNNRGAGGGNMLTGNTGVQNSPPPPYATYPPLPGFGMSAAPAGTFGQPAATYGSPLGNPPATYGSPLGNPPAYNQLPTAQDETRV